MPRDAKTRHKVRRKLEAAVNLCNCINQHLAEAALPFEGVRDEYHDAFLAIGTIVEQVSEMIESLRRDI